MFAKNLRKFRKQANLTQVDLAKEIETIQGYISKLELGEAKPSLDTLLNIHSALRRHGVRVSLDELLGVEEPDENTKARLATA